MRKFKNNLNPDFMKARERYPALFPDIVGCKNEVALYLTEISKELYPIGTPTLNRGCFNEFLDPDRIWKREDSTEKRLEVIGYAMSGNPKISIEDFITQKLKRSEYIKKIGYDGRDERTELKKAANRAANKTAALDSARAGSRQ